MQPHSPTNARRYACVCCALPSKLVKHLAARSEGEQRTALLAQVEHARSLRGQRASSVGKPVAAAQAGTHAEPRRVYDAAGQTFLPGTLLRDEHAPPAHDAAANHVHDNIGIALSFFSQVLGRHSLDGKGMRVDASVHYGFGFANAMWTGEQMIVGDGDGQHVRGLANSLGIIAHELAHGLSQHLIPGGLGVVRQRGAPPTVKGEAGALNESFSDVCASMVKQWHAKQDVKCADWLLGEDIFAPHAGRAVRSLKEPGNVKLTWAEDDQIKDYRSFKPTQDAHTASGIGNHAFYLAATQLGGHSWESLGPVWLQGFGQLKARASYLDAAHTTVAAAEALHGKSSKTHQAVKAAWKAVNVLS